MKSKKEFGFLVSLLMAILFAQNASAIPVGGVLYDSYTATFDTGSGYAIVDSDVYEYASGEYVYTCQIFNQNSTIGFSFFSVGILDGATAWSPSIDSDPIQGWVDPVFWTVVGSPVQSVDYLFANTIDTGQRSALLWFVSDSIPVFGGGMLFGTLSGVGVSTTGNLLTPVPEPATLVLLDIGSAMMTLTRKGKLV